MLLMMYYWLLVLHVLTLLLLCLSVPLVTLLRHLLVTLHASLQSNVIVSVLFISSFLFIYLSIYIIYYDLFFYVSVCLSIYRYFTQIVQMEAYRSFLMTVTTNIWVVLKCVLMEHGVLFVVTSLMIMIPKLHVDNWDILT